MPEIITDTQGKLLAKTWCPVAEIEESAMEQIKALSGYPFLYKWAAIMPDCHAGIGATIGSVIPTEEVVIPSAVGVDIGCGMRAIKTSLTASEVEPLIDVLRDKITARIPLGYKHRDKQDHTAKTAIIGRDSNFWDTMIDRQQQEYPDKDIPSQLGTLGGGNHFIELQKDAAGNVWIMVHSGSRNIGHTIAKRYISAAADFAKRYRLPIPHGLEFLREDSSLGRGYIRDMKWALDFARWNRFVLLYAIKEELQAVFPFRGVLTPTPDIDIHHNYVAKEHHFGRNVWVHRKGATKVLQNTLGIIPGAMGRPSYIVKGKGNADSYMSCSHGAGRVLGRKQAKRTLSMEDFQCQMGSVSCAQVNEDHLDEAPEAYKDIDTVMSNQTDLVEIVEKLNPILVIKG